MKEIFKSIADAHPSWFPHPEVWFTMVMLTVVLFILFTAIVLTTRNEIRHRKQAWDKREEILDDIQACLETGRFKPFTTSYIIKGDLRARLKSKHGVLDDLDTFILELCIRNLKKG